MEDEDLRVGVRHLDRERVQQVVGVATVVQPALQLGDIPGDDSNLPPNCLELSTIDSLGWSQLLPSAESVEPGYVVDVALLHGLLL